MEQELVRRLREMGQAYAEGDQIPPVAMLWPDGDMRWAGVMTELKSQIPELYAFGMIDPDERTGPAIWLRCIEARTAEPSPEKGVPPIFYLPGISRQALRAVEECRSATFRDQPGTTGRAHAPFDRLSGSSPAGQ